MAMCGMNRIKYGYMILFRGIWLKFSQVALAFPPPSESAPKNPRQKKSPRQASPKKIATKKIPPQKIRLDNQRKICYTKFLGRHQRALRDLG